MKHNILRALIAALMILLPIESALALSIDNVQTTALTDTSTSVQWETDELANATVHFGAGTLITSGVSSTAATRQHYLTLPTTRNTTYSYIVESCEPNTQTCVKSDRLEFTAGTDNEPPFLTLNVPTSTRESTMNLIGTTESYSRVDVYVNGQIERRITNTGASGALQVLDVPLPTAQNSLRLEIVDAAGNQYSKSYPVTVDVRAPQLQVVGFKAVSTEPTMTLQLVTDEPISIELFTGLTEDRIPPARIQGLATTTPLGQNIVSIQWIASEDSDVLGYSVYRDDTRIGFIYETRYADTAVSSGDTYQYRISAVDKSCNEGALSEAATIQTATGGIVNVTAPPALELPCTLANPAIDVTGVSTQTINLQEGSNLVRITARDNAGNVLVYENTTIYDTQPPVFLEENLKALTPSYIADVTAHGQASEKATIYVYIGDDQKPVAFGQTDDNGLFSIPFTLDRKIKATKTNLGDRYDFGGGEEGYVNNVHLRAVDIAGRTTDSPVTPIVYAQCGFGNYFNVRLSEIRPSTLNPKLLLDGFGTIGFNIELDYLDIGEAQIDVPSLRIRPLNREEEDKYDKNLQIQTRWNLNRTRGYVQLNVQPPSFPRTDPAHPNGWTNLQKELNISDNRKGNCIIPGTGCYKFPLQLEIGFTKVSERFEGEEQVTGVPGPRAERLVQRVCVPVQVQIDQRVDTKIIPNSFLKNSVKFFESAIEAIDTILRPLQRVYTITFYSFMVMRVVGFFQNMKTRAACKQGLLAITQLAGGAFDRKVAEGGLCTIAYGAAEQSTQQRKENCLRCEQALEGQRKFLKTLKMVGDRLFCPAAPSLQKYVLTQRQAGVRVLKIGEGQGAQEFYEAGRDCAISILDKNKFPTDAQLAKKKNDDGKETDIIPLDETPIGIQNQYALFLENKGDRPDGKGYNKEDVNCANQHPSDPRCCGFMYNEEWSTTCSVFKPNYEITESKVLAQQQGKGAIDKRRFLSARSGICSANGAQQGEYVRTNLQWRKGEISAETIQAQEAARATREAEEQRTGVKVIGTPRTIVTSEAQLETAKQLEKKTYATERAKTKGKPITLPDVGFLKDPWIYLVMDMRTSKDFSVWRGYTIEEVNADGVGILEQNRIPVTTSKSIAKYDESEDLADFFKPGPDGQRPTYQQVRVDWRNKVCGGDYSCSDRDLELAFESVRRKVSGVNEDYIVDPTSDLISNFKCLCINGIIAELRKWQAVLKVVRNCFVKIQTTGDGSAGACQATLSRYVCDFIYSAIKCYRGRFGSGAGKPTNVGGSFHGIGSVASELSGAGSNLEQQVNARYGGNNMFRAAFSEEQLANSVCLFAFTGNWKLDPQAMLEQEELQTPVESQGFLFPCERRFINYDSRSNPPGITNWNYHVGTELIAGASLNYRLELVCSDDYSCDPNEYPGGQCDCVGKGEKVRNVPLGTGRLQQFENIGEAGEVFLNTQSPYRYDKARLVWEWRGKNNQMLKDQAVCAFQTQGGGPFAECAWDVLTDSYRCSTDVFTESFARFIRDPTPAYKSYEAPQFALGEDTRDMKFDVSIEQRLPDIAACSGGSTCADTKYLVYTIKNDQGGVVATNQPLRTPTEGGGTITYPNHKAPIPLTTSGEKMYTVSDVAPLTAELFNIGSRAQENWETAPRGAVNAVISVSGNVNKNLVFRLNKINKQVQIFDVGTVKRIEDTAFETTGAPIKSDGKAVAQENNYLITHEGVTITLDKTSVDAARGYDHIDILVYKANTQPTAQVCNPASPDGKVHKWNAEFSIYDSSSSAGDFIPGSQESVVQGQKQVKRFSFDVICSSTPRKTGTPLEKQGPPVNKPACFRTTLFGEYTCAENEWCKRDYLTYEGKTNSQCLPKPEQVGDAEICGHGQRGPCICDVGTKDSSDDVICNNAAYCSKPNSEEGVCVQIQKAGEKPAETTPGTTPQSRDPAFEAALQLITNSVNEGIKLGEAEAYKSDILKHAKEQKVEPALLLGIMTAESGVSRYKISNSGCVGLFQVCIDDARTYGDRDNDLKRCCETEGQETTLTQCAQELGGAGGDIWKVETSEQIRRINANYKCTVDEPRFTPSFNIELGAKIVNEKQREYKGNYADWVRLTIAAQNIGQSVINEAIKSTGETDPRWETVLIKMITQPEILGSASIYSGLSREAKLGKVREVGLHVERTGYFAKKYYEVIKNDPSWNS